MGLAGPYDFLPISNLNAQPVFHHPNYPAGSQPFEYVRRGLARLCFWARRGTTSSSTPSATPCGMAARLKPVEVPVTLKVYERIDHVLLVASMAWSLRWVVPVLNDVTALREAGRPRAEVARGLPSFPRRRESRIVPLVAAVLFTA